MRFRTKAANDPSLRWDIQDLNLWLECFPGMSSQTNHWPCNHCGGTTHYPINCPFHPSPSRDAGGPQPAATNHLVSCSLTAFFCFSLWWWKKGSGDLTIEFACDEIPSFWIALIAGDKPKSGANDLWGYASY